jgi:hypothetical protein
MDRCFFCGELAITICDFKHCKSPVCQRHKDLTRTEWPSGKPGVGPTYHYHAKREVFTGAIDFR